MLSYPVLVDEETDLIAVSLDDQRARRFLRKLAEESHLTIFVTTDGEVSIWSKDIDTSTLDRIKEVLSEVQEGD